MTETKNKFDFNQGLEQLESIVKKMEVGEMSLEESLTFFEKGVKLSKQCQKALTTAEQKVLKLSEDDNYTNPSIVDEH